MSAGNVIELILLMMVGALLLVLIARRLKVAYPIALVLGGLAIAFIPGLPKVSLEPAVVFSLFLPPLLFASAFFMPWEEFRFARSGKKSAGWSCTSGNKFLSKTTSLSIGRSGG